MSCTDCDRPKLCAIIKAGTRPCDPQPWRPKLPQPGPDKHYIVETGIGKPRVYRWGLACEHAWEHKVGTPGDRWCPKCGTTR